MANFTDALRRLHNNLNILKEREAKYGGNAPLDLLNQIADHQEAIVLTEQVIKDEINEAAWHEGLKSLLVSLNIFGDFFTPFLPLQRPPCAEHFTDREQELAQLSTDLQPGRVVSLCGPGGIGKTALAADSIEKQRKYVTLLFADISNFTSMPEAMDVEDVTEVMNALWKQLDKVITEHGGRIDRHIGNTVRAIWGAYSAREDDPEQAIRAAIAMQAEIRNFNSEVQPSMLFKAHIGVNTGLVLLGPIGTTGEYTAMGDAVDIASSLEQAAPPDNILISHNTYWLVRGVFDVQALEPIAIKDTQDHHQVYLVKRAEPRTFHIRRRGVEGIETRMIGRDAELKQMQDALHTTIEDTELQMITLIGEAGLGKSRLLYEFDNWMELLPDEIHYFKGQSRLEFQTQPYALIRDLFIFRFQIQETDPTHVVRQKIEQGISAALRETDESQMRAYFIGQLLGFNIGDSTYLQDVMNDAQQLRDRGLIYLSDYFEAMSIQAATVILMEDTHWADDSSLDFVNRLALTMANRKLLIVCTARPTLFERRPYWSEGQSFHTPIELAPLSKKHCRQLVVEILQKVTGLPDNLVDMMVNRAEGNPYYIEELVKVLIEDGIIVKDEPHWRVKMDLLTQARIPPTLINVLQARLDGLTSEERMILQQASVIGRVFWDSVIAHISEAAGITFGNNKIETILLNLRDKELIFRRETSNLAGTQEYIFKNAILREVTYESTLKRLRKSYHAIVAEWLLQHTDKWAGKYTGLIAEHLELAGQAGQAVIYLRQAGEQAAERFANLEAVDYYSRALKLISEAQYVERYTLLSAREQLYNLRGDRDAQAQDLTMLQQVADVLADDQARAKVALRRANYAAVTGNYLAVIAATQEVIHLAESSGTVSQEAAGYLQWGWALWNQGDYLAAQSQLERALTLAQTVQLREVEADSLRYLGVVSLRQGDYAGAKAYFEQALNIWQKDGYKRGASIVLNNLGNLARRQGDYIGARAYYEHALRLRREIGHRHGEGVVLNNLGDVCLRQGDYAKAQIYYNQSLDICREIDDHRGESFALNNLGNLYLSLGDYDTAKIYFTQALHLRREKGYRQDEGIVLNNLGDVCLRQGKFIEAQAYYEQFLSICREFKDLRGEGYALTNLGHALTSLNHLDEAVITYQKAFLLRRELGQHHLAMESLTGLAHISLAQGDLQPAQTLIEEILSYLETNSLDGTDDPFWVYLTCYQVLHSNQNPQAQNILKTAYDLLQERAANISDEELHRKFLENVKTHQDLIRAWKASAVAT